MTDARQLVQQIRRQLKALDERIVRHPYLDALELGRVEREKLKVFAEQQYHIVGSDLRSIAILFARHGHLPSRSYLLNLLQGENAAAEALKEFALALGMREEELKASEPLPQAHGYCAFVAWLALYVIQGGLDRGVAPALIHRAARLLQGYELMYWDAMAEAAAV